MYTSLSLLNLWEVFLFSHSTFSLSSCTIFFSLAYDFLLLISFFSFSIYFLVLSFWYYSFVDVSIEAEFYFTAGMHIVCVSLVLGKVHTKMLTYYILQPIYSPQELQYWHQYYFAWTLSEVLSHLWQIISCLA